MKPKDQTPEGTPPGQTPNGNGGEPGNPPKNPEAGDKGSPGDVDYQEKFKHSQAEAIKLKKEADALKAQNEKLKSSLNNSRPSDEELSKKHPDWDFKDDEEKARIRETEALRMSQATQAEALEEMKKKQAWKDDFEDLVSKSEFSDLAKDRKKFREYCRQEGHENVSIETLAQSFLFSSAKEIGAKEERDKMQRDGLETSTGGNRGVQPGDKLTMEDVVHIRKADPARYAQMAKRGDFDEALKK